MMMLVLPPAALLAVALSIGTRRWVAVAALIAMVVGYGVALGVICHDPYFDDNGAPEFIAWRFRWVWAAELGGWFALPLWPLTYACGVACRRAMALRMK